MSIWEMMSKLKGKMDNLDWLRVTVWGFGLASGVGLIFVKHDSRGYGILQSYFAGFIFWTLVVYIPEKRQKLAVYDFMKARYRQFRLDLINNFLQAAGVWEYGRAETLLDHEKFKEFFSVRNNERGADRLDIAESRMDIDPGFLNDIQVSSKHFSDEIDFALAKVATSNNKVYEHLNFLKKRLYDLYHLACYTGDPSKYIGQFFWDTLGWWNEIYGDRPSDWIADAIEELKE